MQMRRFLPVETLLWGSDFPHSVSSFPETDPCAFFGSTPRPT